MFPFGHYCPNQLTSKMWELESGEWVFLHSYFASSLILLWDLSLAGFCGLIKYSENLISFKTLDLSLQQMMIGGIMTILVEGNLGWGQKTKGLLELAKWVLIGMSARSMHFHLLLSFQLSTVQLLLLLLLAWKPNILYSSVFPCRLKRYMTVWCALNLCNIWYILQGG